MCPYVKIRLNEECYLTPLTLFVQDHFLRIYPMYRMNRQLLDSTLRRIRPNQRLIIEDRQGYQASSNAITASHLHYIRKKIRNG